MKIDEILKIIQIDIDTYVDLSKNIYREFEKDRSRYGDLIEVEGAIIGLRKLKCKFLNSEVSNEN